jgi:DNA-binding Lrp family transcriptional regulator
MVEIAGNSEVDKWDRAILKALADNSRIANNALAERVGLAASTVLTRVNSMKDRGIIQRFTTELDYGKLGRGVQAMIALQLRSHQEQEVRSLSARVRNLPEVIQTFHVAGNNDFIVHVAVSTPEKLRDFVLHSLTSDPIVRSVHTNLVFEHQRGTQTL